MNAPGCDFVLSFHLSGRFKCNIETRRAKFIPCHWYSKDNFLRSRHHLSKLISRLNFSFHSLDPCTPYIWVLFSNLLKALSGTAVPWKPCGAPVQRMSPMQRFMSNQAQSDLRSEALKEACNKYTFRALPYYRPFSLTSAAYSVLVSSHLSSPILKLISISLRSPYLPLKWIRIEMKSDQLVINPTMVLKGQNIGNRNQSVNQWAIM